MLELKRALASPIRMGRPYARRLDVAKSNIHMAPSSNQGDGRIRLDLPLVMGLPDIPLLGPVDIEMISRSRTTAAP